MQRVRSGAATPRQVAPSIAAGADTLQATAILEAGARSLKAGPGQSIRILYDDDAQDGHWTVPTGFSQ